VEVATPEEEEATLVEEDIPAAAVEATEPHPVDSVEAVTECQVSAALSSVKTGTLPPSPSSRRIFTKKTQLSQLVQPEKSKNTASNTK
jgi:hypothetical protein